MPIKMGTGTEMPCRCLGTGIVRMERYGISGIIAVSCIKFNKKQTSRCC